jgi:hypothetical protein
MSAMGCWRKPRIPQKLIGEALPGAILKPELEMYKSLSHQG